MQKEVNQSLAREFGLSAEEYGKVLEIMGRTPSLTELGCGNCRPRRRG